MTGVYSDVDEAKLKEMERKIPLRCLVAQVKTGVR